MLARSISAKHLVNTFHLHDQHGRNTKISPTGGHEWMGQHPLSPWGQAEKSLGVAAVYQGELCFPSASRAVPQLSSSKPQVLLVLISSRAWLCWYLPKIHLKVLTAILVALGKAPGEVTMRWREESGAPTAIFSLGSEEDHTVLMFICLPACPSVCQYPLHPHMLSNFWIYCPVSSKTYWQLKAHEISHI